MEIFNNYFVLQIFEPSVSIRVRAQDKAIVESILTEVQDNYATATSNKEVVLKIDSENFLPQNSCGGVELFAMRGRCKIANTLESRLELIAAQLIPEMRNALFGRNPNRKFTD